MELRETSSKWGNLYKRYYFLDGIRIPETYAKWILNHHYWEGFPMKKVKGNWVKIWNIGPKCDQPSYYDTMEQ